jgi:hypothetical protein
MIFENWNFEKLNFWKFSTHSFRFLHPELRLPDVKKPSRLTPFRGGSSLAEGRAKLAATWPKGDLGWPSGWVEPELGRPTLGLGRVGHSASARRVGPDKHFWPSGLTGFGFLSDGLNRTRIFVRSDVQLELVVWPKPESNVQPTGWAAILGFRVGSGHASPFEPEPWANSRTLTLGLGFDSCSSGRVGLKKSVRTQPDGHTREIWVLR